MLFFTLIALVALAEAEASVYLIAVIRQVVAELDQYN